MLGHPAVPDEMPAAKCPRPRGKYSDDIYQEFCKDVCGAVLPIEFWMQENVDQVTALLDRYDWPQAVAIYKDIVGEKNLALIRATAHNAWKEKNHV